MQPEIPSVLVEAYVLQVSHDEQLDSFRSSGLENPFRFSGDFPTMLCPGAAG